MLKRVITAAVALALFVPVLIFSDTPVFPAVLSILSAVAVYEIFDCFGLGRRIALCIPLYLLAGVAPFAIRYGFYEYVLYALPLVVIYLLAAAMLSRGKIKHSDNAGACFLSIYAIFGISILTALRDAEFGKYIYLLAFIGAWATDTGAYFGGVLFGKHKLIPEVSPKKTVEGSIGGVVGCCVGFAVWAAIVCAVSGAVPDVPVILMLALAAGAVSQIGDLVASYAKRERGIKDYGFIFPGHGGVMDRFDSVIAVAAAIWALLCLTGLSPLSAG